MNDKELLRKVLRARHPGQARRDEESAQICAHILSSDWYRNAQVIGGYMPLMREADIMPVLAHALQSGKTLALPLCDAAPRMTLRRVDSLDALISGAYGILEPALDAEIIPVDAVDLLLVPLEGIDVTGMRLGKGGGYYDCLLAGKNVPTLGCALSWQWTDAVPSQPWDRPLMACADCRGILLFTPTPLE